MPRRLLTAPLALAATLLTCSTALAQSSVVVDADEPNVPAERDIEWVAVDRPPSVSGRWVRHTIKFRAPMAQPPCIYLRGDRGYKLYGGAIHGGGPTSAVVTSYTPAGAPDTASYSFDVNRIGNPASYDWFVTNCRSDVYHGDADRAPDTGFLTHWMGPPFQPALP